MAKFDYMEFIGGSTNEFVVHANKYTKEEAIKLMKEETAFDGSLTIDNISKQWCKYYVQAPGWCSYEGDGGCYSYCESGERGAFPVWVITY